jgi:hypothetical protein
MDDLDSAEVSRMVDEGLMLWGPPEVGIFSAAADETGNRENTDPPESPLFTPTPPSGEINAESRLLEQPGVGTADLQHDIRHSSEEDMVENMLRSMPTH